MPSIPTNSTYTILFDYARLAPYLDSPTPVMLGLGVGTWEGATPPLLNPTDTQINALFAYYPVTKGSAGRTSARPLTANSINVNGFYYTPEINWHDSLLKSGISYDTIYSTRQVYLETDVKHNLLSQPYFNTVGLYLYTQFAAGVDPTKEIFLPSELTQAILVYEEAFRNITVEPNLTQRIQILINP